jgi:hypothetical protein
VGGRKDDTGRIVMEGRAGRSQVQFPLIYVSCYIENRRAKWIKNFECSAEMWRRTSRSDAGAAEQGSRWFCVICT